MILTAPIKTWDGAGLPRLVLAFAIGAALWLSAPRCFAAEPVSPETPRVTILVYHRFGQTVADSMTVTTPVFEWQLDYIRQHGYSVVPLADVVRYVKGQGPLPARAVAITADDGHRSVFTVMKHFIERERIPVTLFIYPSAISNASYAMTWEQLAALKATGLFSIESHSYWHPNFRTEKRRLSADAYRKFLEMQMTKPRQVLARRLDSSADMLAWPFGIYDDELIAAARSAGYVAAFTIERRNVARDDNVMTIPRFLVTDRDKGEAFALMLSGRSAKPREKGRTPYNTDAAIFGFFKFFNKADRFPMSKFVRFAGLRFAAEVAAIAVLLAYVMGLAAAEAFTVTVIDASTKRPLEGAFVTINDKVARTDSNGTLEIEGAADEIGFKAWGYRRKSVALRDLTAQSGQVALTPLRPKALYLSFYGIGSTKLREAALDLIGRTELNAVVIDVKGDRGMVAFKSSVPLAEQAGAQHVITMGDARATLGRLHQQHLYAIARIVVFKDDPLATARPEFAVKRANGALFRDREKLAWTDPFNHRVWDYNIAIAIEAASLGFDEIQFDYVRFPDASGLKFSKPTDMKSRMAAISGFLGEARRRLTPYNVYVASDIFGYVTWNLDDTHIGQRLEELSPAVDYISPMLYPSCFQFGIPGYRMPLQHPYEIVFLSLQNARERSGIPAVRFRPWLQAFRDYAFDRREFTGREIRAQISAAEKFGSDGWMLWNPRNTYTADGMKVAGERCKDEAPQ